MTGGAGFIGSHVADAYLASGDHVWVLDNLSSGRPSNIPEDAEFKPTGESPLAAHQGFLNARCPRCSGPARRETDTIG